MVTIKEKLLAVTRVDELSDPHSYKKMVSAPQKTLSFTHNALIRRPFTITKQAPSIDINEDIIAKMLRCALNKYESRQ